MNIREKKEGKVTVLYLDGKVDINSANLIETTGRLSAAGCTKILCNMKDINVVDNNGLSILAIAYKNVVNKGSVMKFCNVPENIKELFRMVRLDLVFDIYDDQAKAITAFATVSRIDKLYLRRRFKRLEFYHPVKYYVAPAGQKKMSGKILNISGEGVFIYTKNILPVLTKVKLEIKLSGDAVFNVDGKIIWLADNDLQPHCFPGMGIRFVNISKETQREILDFIDKNLTHRSDLL